MTSGTVKLYDLTDQSTVLATATVVVDSGTTHTTTNTATFTLSTVDTISAGGKVTYLVKADLTTEASAQKVNISTKVKDDTSFATTEAAANVSGNVVWSDRSASSHAAGTMDWTNGYKVSGLPTEQVSMSL